MKVRAASAPVLRVAAAELGAIYRAVERYGNGQLGDWVVPPKRGHDPNHLLLLRLAQAYGTQSFTIRARYQDAYHLVVGHLEAQMTLVAPSVLIKQSNDLRALASELGNMKERLHTLAAQTGKSAGGYGRTRNDFEEAYKAKDVNGPPTATWTAHDYVALDRALDAEREKRITKRLGDTLRSTAALDPREYAANDRVADLARLLFTHPKRVAIFEAYAKSAAAGTNLSLALIEEARRAVDAFAHEIRSKPNHLWRYPSLVVLAVRSLGLLDVDGFPEFSVALAPVLEPKGGEREMLALQLVVACVAVVFTGPLALATLGVIDLALTGASGALTYMRDREHDMLALGSGFRASGALAERKGYGDTALAGAAALLSGFALLGPGLALLRKAKPGRQPTAASMYQDAGHQSRRAKDGVGVAPRTEGPRTLTDKELQKELEKGLQRVNAKPDLTQTSIRKNRSVDKNSRVGSAAESISPQLAAARFRKAGEEPSALGPGAPRELDPEQFEAGRGVVNRLGPRRVEPMQDYNVVPMKQLTAPPRVQAGHLRTDPLDKAAMARATPPIEPELKTLKRANEPGRRVAPGTSRKIVTRQQQLHGLGKHVMDRNAVDWLRDRTPSDDLKEWARKSLPEGASDPILPDEKVDFGVADHIVGVELIYQFDGFAELSRQAQLTVLNLTENFMVVSNRVNSARNSRPFSDLTHLLGKPIPPPILSSLRAREVEAAKAIQRRINELYAQEAAARLTRRGMPSPTPVSTARPSSPAATTFPLTNQSRTASKPLLQDHDDGGQGRK